MRNKIMKLAERNRLNFSHLPLPPQEEMALRRLFPEALEKLLSPDVFEFTWEDAGIWVDANERTHYPDVPQDEVLDATEFPVPHEKIVIQTRVPREGSAESDTFLWYVEQRPHGRIAIPFVFRDDTLSFFGTTLLFDRRVRDVNGAPMFGCHCPKGHRKIYDEDEFYDHNRMLLRFLRILCLPQVVVEVFEVDEGINRARARRGRAPLPRRSVVRIAPEAIRYIVPQDAPVEVAPRELVAPHYRRAHMRTLRSGRRVPVRSCVVNGNGEMPAPQDFHVG
ncbi:hypothetical protein NGR_c06790 [Sinorhizobium fredii NGR234]|uniref:Uncharacterized protein n=1 Tax=Sinorhizobium fredii (strain NBRC 101917 / NGR234) TaxID=394 RepID=C3MIC4_SINFN|nr:hypothetical protein [Sinorhizobium fredii]ACP24472.1 hypothetical protein NGR_c06790 [Sinorhizobium fredii NGR234]